MSKRVTLSTLDMVLITVALEHLHKSSVLNPGAYPGFALASRQRMDQIIERFGAHDALKDGSGVSEDTMPKEETKAK